MFDRKIITKRDQGSSNQSHMNRSNEGLHSNELWKIQIQMEYMKINKPLSAMNFEDVRRLLNGYDSYHMIFGNIGKMQNKFPDNDNFSILHWFLHFMLVLFRILC